MLKLLHLVLFSIVASKIPSLCVHPVSPSLSPSLLRWLSVIHRHNMRASTLKRVQDRDKRFCKKSYFSCTHFRERTRKDDALKIKFQSHWTLSATQITDAICVIWNLMHQKCRLHFLVLNWRSTLSHSKDSH